MALENILDLHSNMFSLRDVCRAYGNASGVVCRVLLKFLTWLKGIVKLLLEKDSEIPLENNKAKCNVFLFNHSKTKYGSFVLKTTHDY